MLNQTILPLFSAAGFVTLIHWIINVIIFTYIIFAFVLLRQVKSLNAGLKTDAAFMFTAISYAHLFAAITLFIISVILI